MSPEFETYIYAFRNVRKAFFIQRPRHVSSLSLGLLSFTFVKLATGRHREISPLIWVLSALFLLRSAFLGAE
jgi:hypothetical protein